MVAHGTHRPLDPRIDAELGDEHSPTGLFNDGLHDCLSAVVVMGDTPYGGFAKVFQNPSASTPIPEEFAVRLEEAAAVLD